MKKLLILLTLLFSFSIFANDCNEIYNRDYISCVNKTNQSIEICKLYTTPGPFYKCQLIASITHIQCISEVHNNYKICIEKICKK
jgi:hypothetical protein